MSRKMCMPVWVIVAALLMGVTGCSGTPYGGLLPGSPKAYQVKVVLDHVSWRQAYGDVLPSLEVDLVGINESERPTWENYPVSKYFSPNDPLRRDADRTTVTFTNNDRRDKIVKSNNPVWGKWVGKKFGSSEPGKGAKWLFVIANIPGVGGSAMASAQDPRRVILPLKGSAWPMGTGGIEIVIKSSMAICTTPLKSQK